MQTIGERLEEARKRKGISIREAAEATKIRGDYLHKFENNQFDIRLPDIYIRGFLRIYANYLKLPSEKIIADFLALGLGEGGRPSGRGLNREIYGKMEISHSSASAAAAKKSAQTAAAGSPASATPTEGGASAQAPQRPPFQPRMPLGGLDRALLSKNGIWIGLAAVVVLALVIWGVVALVGGGSRGKTDAPSAIVAEPIYIVALRPVQILEAKAKSDSRNIAPSALPVSLAEGQRYQLPNVGMLLRVSAQDAVQIEFMGRRYAASGGRTGPGILDLPEFGASN